MMVASVFLSACCSLLLLLQVCHGWPVEAFVCPPKWQIRANVPIQNPAVVGLWTRPPRPNDERPNDNNENEKEAQANSNDENDRNLIKGIQYAAGRAVSKVKQGGSGVVSAAGATTSRLVGLAEQGGSNVKSVVVATSERLSSLAEKGSSGVSTVATAATINLVGWMEKGSADVASIANITTTTAGDIVRWIDGQAKEGANVANAKSKDIVLGFTGKQEYKFGDISKELSRRVASAEIDMNDIKLLIKIVLAVGASFGPLAKALPVTVLLEMLNISLEKQIGGKVLEVLAGTLDERFSAAFSSEDKFQLGDAVKRSALFGILKFTGKDSYEPGDIERAVVQEEKKKSSDSQEAGEANTKTLDIRVGPEFQDWDEKFRQSHPDLEELDEMSPKDLDMTVVKELAEDGAFLLSSVGSKFCIHCGTKLPGVAKFCWSCGEQQQP